MPDISQMIQQPGNPNMMPGQAAGPPDMSQPQPGQAAGPEMATPAQIQELQQLMGKVKNAQSELVSHKLIKKNEVAMKQKQLLQGLLSTLQQSGVDPNPESIKNFLMTLEKTNPDLLEMFVNAFQNLGAGPLAGMAPQAEPIPTMTGGAPSTGTLMDQFRSLGGGQMPQ